jgi:hypothetical protein
MIGCVKLLTVKFTLQRCRGVRCVLYINYRSEAKHEVRLKSRRASFMVHGRYKYLSCLECDKKKIPLVQTEMTDSSKHSFKPHRRERERE